MDDVICRYGGEEFGIILPESSAENAVIRANALREETKKMDIQYKNHAWERSLSPSAWLAFPTMGKLLKNC